MPNLATSRSRAPFSAATTFRHVLSVVTSRVRWPESDYLVNRERKFVYCPIAKVACSSLKAWFLQTVQSQAEAQSEHDVAQRYSLRALGGRAAFRVLRDRDYFTFAFVRDPWARLVSAYLNKFLKVNVASQQVVRSLRSTRGQPGLPDVTFREFVRFLMGRNPAQFDVHWRPQHLYLPDDRLDFVGRFERLEDDFAIIRQRLGSEFALTHRNPTRYELQHDDELMADHTPAELLRRPALPGYRQFYTPELVDAVGKLYARDIQRFGYEFDES